MNMNNLGLSLSKYRIVYYNIFWLPLVTAKLRPKFIGFLKSKFQFI
jgi:hypothetical protein